MERRSLAIRTHPLVFGVAVFLASELMLFAGLLASYYQLRTLDSPWPPPDVHLDLAGSSIGTGMLALSSFTMFLAQRCWTRRRFRLARVAVLSTLLLGCVFLAIAVHGYAADTFTIASHAYGSIYYLLTGVHALHVTAGLLLLTALALALRRPAFTATDFAGAEAISYYWHFVFIVWIGIYSSIYLVR